MDELALLLLILLLIFLAIPVICLIKIVQTDNRVGRIEKTLNEIKVLCLRQERPIVTPQAEQNPSPIPAKVTKEEPVFTPAPDIFEPAIPEVIVPIVRRKKEEYVAPEVPLPPIPERPLFKKKEPLPAFRFENLLSKIGIITLVLGVGFFVKYAIDKDWINEVGRVAIGILTGGVLIGIAHKLRKKYDLFSAIMVGGGISVFYITITLAFREYGLFSQPVAFALLIGITLFSVVLSLIYDRQELALFSLLGGFASPLMISTGGGNYIVLFTFLFILNSGMLIISMRKKWRLIGIVSFVCTLGFYWTWLLTQFEQQYTGAFIFAVLFFIQFYLLGLFDHFLSGRKISPFQVWIILANNLSVFAASIYIVDKQNLAVRGVLTIAMAVVNAAVMWWLFKRKAVDKRLIYMIIAIVLSFVSLAVPMQLNGHVITMFWAAECVILLWMWKKSNIKVFHLGFILVGFLTIISYLMDVHYIYNDSLPVIFNSAFITGLVVVAALFASRYLLWNASSELQGVLNMPVVKKGLVLAIILITYLVPYFEIHYQFDDVTKFDTATEIILRFGKLVVYLYTIVYLSVLTCIYRKSFQPKYIWGLLGLLIVYQIIVLPEMIDIRRYLFLNNGPRSLFLLHYLTLPALAVIFYVAVKRMKQLPKREYTWLGWLLVVAAVILLSVELDNTVIQWWGNPQNYSSLLHDVHTIGYPILWGVLAMILMVWGLKAKEALLRQISLGFFGFIILKFYVNDIWIMSQTGRIISFVVLGIILLSVSFLIQKIKVLIKDDTKETDTTPENKQE